MSNRSYRIILGTALIASLYFHSDMIVVAIIGLLFFEGITDLRVPKLIAMIRGNSLSDSEYDPALAPFSLRPRYSIDSERIWRLAVGAMLAICYMFSDQSYLWLLPWFMGFAILGAGVSTVCPILLSIKWAGFR